MYFSRSTESDPFIQNITNDNVLTNIIRRELNGSTRYSINFPTVAKQAQRLPAVSSELQYYMPRARQQAFTVLVFRA